MASDGDVAPETTPGYKAPAEKALDQIVGQDTEDEALQKYKQQLLGTAASGEKLEPCPGDPRHVVVNKLEILVDGRDPVSLDLSGKLDDLKKKSFVLKEGCQYKIKIYFYVQREIVTGLKYVHAVYRKGIRCDKEQFMVGSYGPQMEMHSYVTPAEDAPSGMIQRGTYTIKSLFTDDDKKEHLKWEWSIDIKKDWAD